MLALLSLLDLVYMLRSTLAATKAPSVETPVGLAADVHLAIEIKQLEGRRLLIPFLNVG